MSGTTEDMDGVGPDPALDGCPGVVGARGVAAAMLAAGASYQETGDAVGKSKRTIVRWMAEPAFARLVADLRGERLSVVTGRLAQVTSTAVDVFIETMADVDPAVRLRAAHLTLDWTMRLRRAVDLEARVLEVERRQGVRAADDDGDAPVGQGEGVAT